MSGHWELTRRLEGCNEVEDPEQGLGPEEIERGNRHWHGGGEEGARASNALAIGLSDCAAGGRTSAIRRLRRGIRDASHGKEDVLAFKESTREFLVDQIGRLATTKAVSATTDSFKTTMP
ncbi:hypothetical protein MRB53_041391 [Persea americana]|nr:hypothetical protein MRB53_041391 [Persea americana]